MERLRNNDFMVVMEMKHEIEDMRKRFGHRINDAFLNHIEEHLVVFVEDGTDLSEVNLGRSEGFVTDGPKETRREIKWKHFPKQVVLNINKYIAKYNFEIARKLSGVFYKETKEDTRQKMFETEALQELF